MAIRSELAVGGRYESEAPAGGWQTVLGQELHDLWLGGRGLVLLLAFSFVLSILTFLAATNQELNLLDQRDTVNLVMQITLAVGIGISLLLSADAISGERERGTFEMLLLSPLEPRQIATGKLLAALSAWPLMVAISIPYVWVLRVGSAVFFDAVASAFLVGALVAVAFATFGLIVSAFAQSNRVSLAVSFFVFLALIVPTQLPGSASSGWVANLLLRINPMTAGSHFMKTLTVKGAAWQLEADWLISPVIAVLIALFAFLVVSARIRLHGVSR